MVFFFVQAEDGIRDLVRSRGLGDVYKRQALVWRSTSGGSWRDMIQRRLPVSVSKAEMRLSLAVSYTHLTLPTSDLV